METKQPRRACVCQSQAEDRPRQDPDFPGGRRRRTAKPFKILPGGRAIAWDEGEINAHLARQMAERKQQRIA